MEPAPRRSKREHQPSAKATASSTSFPVSSATTSTSRRPQRRRVPPSASMTVLRDTVTSLASARPVSVAVDTVLPNGQRRRLRAAAHTSVPHTGVHLPYPRDSKVLGKYSSRECVLLCKVILSQLEAQTLASTVLDDMKSPVNIQWKAVAKTMEIRHRLKITPTECQLVWKFLAYAQIPVSDAEKKELLLPDSDEEEFYQSPKELNARLAANRVKPVEMKEKQMAISDETTRENQAATTKEAAGKKNTHEVQQNTTKKLEERDTLDAQKKDRAAGAIQLYPTYLLPTGAPDAWYRPFGPKDAMSLTFVASRFLRRKPTPLPAQSRFQKSTVTLGPSAAGTSDLKRNQAEPVHNAEAAKRLKLVTLPVSTTPCTYKPSSTPPLRARSELEFFGLRLREEQARKIPGATFKLSAADVQRRYGEASAEIRRQCRTLAAYDVERFNQELLRVHTRQKETGSGNTKLEPTLALTPSKLAAPPSQASSTELVSTASGASLTKLPRSACAVVTAAVAKTKSNEQ